MKLDCKICGKKVDTGNVVHSNCYDKLVKEIEETTDLASFFIRNKRTRVGMKTIESKLQKILIKYGN